MQEETMSRDDLLNELAALRNRVAELEESNEQFSQTEQALRESEERLRTVMTNAPLVLFATDKNGIFTMSEGHGLQSLGRVSGEIVGQSVYSVYADKPAILDSIHRALSGRPVRSSVEVEGVTFDTQYMPLKDESGRIIGSIGVATDVSERRRAEEAEQLRGRELETLFKVARIISQPGTIEEKATHVLNELVHVFEAEWAALRLFDEEDEGLRLIASIGEGLGDVPPPLVIKGSQLMSGEAFRKGEPLVINDYPSYPNALPERIAQGFRSAVSLVITSGDKPVGTINVNSKRSNHFIPQRVRILKAVADGMGALLDNARLLDVVRESEETYRILFEHSRDAIFIVKDGSVTDVNQAALDMFGYTIEEAIGFNTSEVYASAEDARRVRDELETKGFVQDTEVKFLRKDGTELDCIISITRRRDEDGEHIGDYGIIHDITERKRAEERLRENERRLQALVRALPVPVSLTRMSDGLYIGVNEHLGTLFGLPQEELLNRRSADFFYDISDRQTLIERLQKDGFIRNLDVRGKKADGSLVWLTVSVQPFEFEGEKLLLTVFYDTTERRRAEELFRTLAQSSPVGMFVIKDNQYSFVNNQVTLETGYSAEELIGQDSLALVHPDDRDKVVEGSRQMMSGQLSTPYEFRGVSKSGEIYWLIGSAVEIEYEGSPALLGTYMDVTERKRAEEALRESEEESRRLAHENALMAEIGRIIGSSLNLEDVYEGFGEQVQQLIPFDRISVGIVNEASGAFLDSYAMGLEVPSRGFGIINPLEKSVTAELVRTRKGIIVPMRDENELAERFPLLVPGYRVGLRTSMSVPLITKDEVIGALHLQSTTPDAYTGRELALAERMAYYIASAVENARLYEEAGEAAILGERNRMAREIHDTMAQGFTGIILQMEAAEQSVEEAPSEIPEHLSRAKSLARECLQEARRSVWNLLPKALEERPLDQALEEEVRLFNSANREQASFSVSGARRELPSDVQAALLRVCQESLTNIRKHAEADTIEVRLAYQNQAVCLEVHDNGKGFDPANRQIQPGQGGFGLTGMLQRARLLRGSLEIDSKPDSGTKVEVTIPTS